jgi:hypothetical protein
MESLAPLKKQKSSFGQKKGVGFCRVGHEYQSYPTRQKSTFWRKT